MPVGGLAPGRREHLWPRAPACSGLHRPGARPAYWRGPFSSAQTVPPCSFWKGGLPRKPWTVVAQYALTLMGLALGWVPPGCFWGRMEAKEAHLWLCAELLPGWPRQRGGEGVGSDRWGSGTVPGSPRTVF